MNIKIATVGEVELLQLQSYVGQAHPLLVLVRTDQFSADRYTVWSLAPKPNENGEYEAFSGRYFASRLAAEAHYDRMR